MKNIVIHIMTWLTGTVCGRKTLQGIFYLKNKQRLLDLKSDSVYHYCQNVGTEIKMIEPSHIIRQKVNVNLLGDPDSKALYEAVLVYPKYMVRLNEVLIMGGDDGILCDNYLVNDRLDYIRAIALVPTPKYFLLSDKSQTHMLVKMKEPVEVIEKGLYMVGRWPEHYWHFTHELLTRLYWYDKYTEYRDYPLLVDEAVLEQEANKLLLQYANTTGHPIIWVKSGEFVKVKELVYMSCPVAEVPKAGLNPGDNLNYTQNIIFHFKEEVGYLRQAVFRNIKPGKANRRIFVARNRSDRLTNEKEVSCFFKQQGFEILYSDEFTFETEVRAFAEAEILISTMGGAMTNLLWCSKGATVVLIYPKRYMDTSYQSLADIIGFHLYQADAEVISDLSWIQVQYRLSVSSCEKLYQDLHNKIPLEKKL